MSLPSSPAAPTPFFPEAAPSRVSPFRRWTGPGRRSAARRRRLRRVLAALLAGGCVWALSVAFLPRGPGEAVLVADRDLGVGERLGPANVRSVAVDGGLVPDGALRDLGRVGDVVVAHPVGAGEIVTTARLASPSAFGPLAADERAVHVSLADAGSVGMLRPGARVDLVSAGDGRVVGANLVVLAVDEARPAGPLDPGGGGAAGSGGIVVAAPTTGLAPIVTAGSAHGPGLHVAVRSAAA